MLLTAVKMFVARTICLSHSIHSPDELRLWFVRRQRFEAVRVATLISVLADHYAAIVDSEHAGDDGSRKIDAGVFAILKKKAVCLKIVAIVDCIGVNTDYVPALVNPTHGSARCAGAREVDGLGLAWLALHVTVNPVIGGRAYIADEHLPVVHRHPHVRGTRTRNMNVVQFPILQVNLRTFARVSAQVTYSIVQLR